MITVAVSGWGTNAFQRPSNAFQRGANAPTNAPSKRGANGYQRGAFQPPNPLGRKNGRLGACGARLPSSIGGALRCLAPRPRRPTPSSQTMARRQIPGWDGGLMRGASRGRLPQGQPLRDFSALRMFQNQTGR